MFKKAFLGIALISASLAPMNAWALPKSMTMTTEMVSSEGGRNIKAIAKVWYLNMKMRSEVNSSISMKSKTSSSPVRVNNKAVIIMDLKKKIAYMLEAKSKTALKVDTAQISKLSGAKGGSGAANFMDPTFFTDSKKMRAELKKQGAKKIGKAKILGHTCTIWEIKKNNVKVPTKKGTIVENVRVKMWLADNISIPLQVEFYSSKRGKVASLKTKKIQLNVPISSSLFKVPSGYKVTNLMDMFKTP